MEKSFDEAKEDEFLKSWEIVECVLHDVLIFREYASLRAFYEFVQHLRFLGYDRWFDSSAEVSDLRLIRGESWIDFDENRVGGMRVLAYINGHRFEVFVNPIAYSSEVQALLEMLMIQPLE